MFVPISGNSFGDQVTFMDAGDFEEARKSYMTCGITEAKIIYEFDPEAQKSLTFLRLSITTLGDCELRACVSLDEEAQLSRICIQRLNHGSGFGRLQQVVNLYIPSSKGFNDLSTRELVSEKECDTHELRLIPNTMPIIVIE